MQHEILALKRRRRQAFCALDEKELAYSYQRPSLVTCDTAESVCKDVSSLTDPLVEALRSSVRVPTTKDLSDFSSMWGRTA